MNAKRENYPFFIYGCVDFVHMASKIVKRNRETIMPFI